MGVHCLVRLVDGQGTARSPGAIVTVYVGAYERDVAGDGMVVHKHFIHAGGRLIAEYRIASASGNTLHLVHDDHLGSVAALTAADGTAVALSGKVNCSEISVPLLWLPNVRFAAWIR